MALLKYIMSTQKMKYLQFLPKYEVQVIKLKGCKLYLYIISPLIQHLKSTIRVLLLFFESLHLCFKLRGTLFLLSIFFVCTLLDGLYTD